MIFFHTIIIIINLSKELNVQLECMLFNSILFLTGLLVQLVVVSLTVRTEIIGSIPTQDKYCGMSRSWISLLWSYLKYSSALDELDLNQIIVLQTYFKRKTLVDLIWTKLRFLSSQVRRKKKLSVNTYKRTIQSFVYKILNSSQLIIFCNLICKFLE